MSWRKYRRPTGSWNRTYLNHQLHKVENDALNHRVKMICNKAGNADLTLLISGGSDQVSVGRDRFGVRDNALDVFYDVVESKQCPKAVVIHVLHNEACAGIRLVTADDAWRQEVTMNLNISQSDITHLNKGLCRTGSVQQRVYQRASGSHMVTRLVLLLGTDVDRPPYWIVNFHIFVKNVSDFTSRAG